MIRFYQSCLRNRLVRSLIAVCAVGGFVLFFLLLIIFIYFERKASEYDIEAVSRLPAETRVIDATGTLVGILHESAGGDLPLESISPQFLNAVIAREDSRFWEHGGIDHIGILRANIRNLQEGRVVQGASTITMQLSRMTYDLREKSVKRKLVEAAVARRIERRYNKKEILRIYVNRVFMGTGMHGVEEAALGYFGKKPSNLTLTESAMLAGIIRAPNGFSPFRNVRAARREMKLTLDRMAVEGHIDEQTALQAKSESPRVLDQSHWMNVLKERQQGRGEDWFLSMIEERIDELLPDGKTGGFVVQTTIDHRLQRAAANAIHRWVSGVERVPGYRHPTYPQLSSKGEPTYLQGAGIVIDNLSGAIRAIVGGRDYSHSEFNRAIHRNRQAGSIIKPLVYAAAFETGLFPGTLISDEKVQPGEFDWWPEQDWSPLNADGVHAGLQPAEVGLISSRNTMTVRVGEAVGFGNVRKMLQLAGLAEKEVPRDPQVFIGNISVSLLGITSAYSAFPSQGVRREPYLIDSIRDLGGREIYRARSKEYQLFSRSAAWMTSVILEKVVEQGGSGARLRQWGFDAPAGGKTGTTDDFFDAWFVGYTSRLTGGFWIGMDQPSPIVSGAYGGRVTMPIWKDTMEAAAAIGYEFNEFPAVENFEVRLCRHSGLLASPQCEKRQRAYTESVPSPLIPRKFCKLNSN